ncbi:MAG: hypothetical protein IT438_08485 [Phycisphaerales bacterium]|nr:hypothetical protein [Phycisphaerales bacterium]
MAGTTPILGITPMRIENPTNPTNPFHIARAYGVNPAARAAPSAPAQPIEKVAGSEQSRSPSAAQALVAAVVPGGVNFREDGSAAQPSAPVIQMYRHPADKNAAATAVQVGRRLDVKG